MSIPKRGKRRKAAAKKPAATSSPPARPPAARSPDASASAASVVAPHTAAILAIGDEVLRGEITNRNATFLAERLFDAGLEVCEQRVVADQAAAMRRALEELAQRSRLTESDANRLADKLKAGWWAANKDRFIPSHER